MIYLESQREPPAQREMRSGGLTRVRRAQYANATVMDECEPMRLAERN